MRVAGTDRAIVVRRSRRQSAGSRTLLDGARMPSCPPQPTYPNGTHLAEVEIDPETGATCIAELRVVDDFGATVNPLLLAGQVHGGAVQGIGQALMESAVYDPDSGQLSPPRSMDYALPRADDVPAFAFETRNVPLPDQSARRERRGRGGHHRLAVRR